MVEFIPGQLEPRRASAFAYILANGIRIRQRMALIIPMKPGARRPVLKPGQPNLLLSSWLFQSSVLAKRLCTTRTRHTPPARASTLHTAAMGGEPPQRFGATDC